jgi:lysyl-tRNA synthetase class 2
MEKEKLTDQEQFRREKIAKLISLGVDPFGQKYVVTHSSEDMRNLCVDKPIEEIDAAHIEVSYAGRIMTIRSMGKAAFITLQDLKGRIQAYISVDTVGVESYEIFKLADLGDIVGIKGYLMHSKTGELTIKVQQYTHLVKALKPLPDKFHGLVDVEDRYRKRYLDLIVNDEARKIALTRPLIIKTMKEYFDSLGFLEVETSVLTPILGGAAARPFVTHHNALDRDFYLRIATELPLKKLLVGGLERVYEFGRLFRNEGMDTRHNPEFTTVELYQAYGDLSDMMDICQGVFQYTAKKVLKTLKFNYGDVEIDLSKPFRKVTMVQLIKENTGIDFKKKLSFKAALELANEHDIHLEKHQNSVGYVINAFFEKYCEDKLIQPTFVCNHPLEISPLTKKSKDPRFTERFELFIVGSEFGNAYSELNDPLDQIERFEEQLKAKELGDDEASEMDLEFVDALLYGMPPAGGIGIGIDRFVMLLTNSRSIREVILFPHMKAA